MLDERKETQAGLYVAGALPPAEAREFEAALRSDIELQLLVTDLRAAAGAMAAAFPRVDPPPRLREKVLAAVAAREASKVLSLPGAWQMWVPWALAACFAALCLVLLNVSTTQRRAAAALNQQIEALTQQADELRGGQENLAAQAAQQAAAAAQQATNLQMQVLKLGGDLKRERDNWTAALRLKADEFGRQSSALRRLLDAQEADNQSLRQVIEALTTFNRDFFTNLRVAVLKPTEAAPPRAAGVALWDTRDQRGLVLVEGLAALPLVQDYQLWLFDPRFAAPVSGGAVSVDAQGNARVTFKPTTRVDQVERFALSIERKGGGTGPQGKLVLVGK
jgi:anti-sigma-K factor RskA